MNKTVENLEKTLGLLFLAYVAGLLGGELLGEKVLRSQAEVPDELFKGLARYTVPTHVPT